MLAPSILARLRDVSWFRKRLRIQPHTNAVLPIDAMREMQDSFFEIARESGREHQCYSYLWGVGWGAPGGVPQRSAQGAAAGARTAGASLRPLDPQ